MHVLDNGPLKKVIDGGRRFIVFNADDFDGQDRDRADATAQ